MGKFVQSTPKLLNCGLMRSCADLCESVRNGAELCGDKCKPKKLPVYAQFNYMHRLENNMVLFWVRNGYYVYALLNAILINLCIAPYNSLQLRTTPHESAIQPFHENEIWFFRSALRFSVWKIPFCSESLITLRMWDLCSAKWMINQRVFF